MAGLFGMSKPAVPKTPPPPPDIGDAAGEAAAREQTYRTKRKFGVADTFLTGNLGPGSNQAKRTTLG